MTWSEKTYDKFQLNTLLSKMNSTNDYEKYRSAAANIYSMELYSRILPLLAYCSIFLIGLIGNAWVAYVILCVLRYSRRQSQVKSVQIYILALCLGDFITLAFSLMLISDLVYNQWIIDSPVACRLYLSSESVSKFYVPFVLVSLSYYCYIKICRSEQENLSSNSIIVGNNNASSNSLLSNYFRDIDSTKCAVLSVLVCAILAFILCAPVYAYGDLHYIVFNVSSFYNQPSFISDDTDNADRGHDQHQQPRLTIMIMPKCAFSPPDYLLNFFLGYSFVAGFAIPATLFTYFYTAILLRSRNRHRSSLLITTNNNARHNAGHASGNQKFWRVAKTASGLVGFYLICWAPYWSVNLYHAWWTGPDQQLPDQVAGSTTDQPDQYQHERQHLTADALAEFESQNELSESNGVDEETSEFSVVLAYFVHMLPYINCTGYPILYTILNRQIIDAYKSAKRKMRRQQKLSAAGQKMQRESRGQGPDQCQGSTVGHAPSSSSVPLNRSITRNQNSRKTRRQSYSDTPITGVPRGGAGASADKDAELKSKNSFLLLRASTSATPLLGGGGNSGSSSVELTPACSMLNINNYLQKKATTASTSSADSAL